MNRLVFRLLPLALLSALLPAAPSAADDGTPPISVALTPLSEHGPYKWRLALTAHEAREVATDRRLLRLTVRPTVEGRRRSPRLRCSHPDAPRRATRTKTMTPGESHEEWVDLRMYCWGRALRALENGEATVEVEYGFPRGGRDRFVAREDGERRPPHRVPGGAIQWRPPAEVEAGDPPLVEVGLRPTSTRGTPSLQPTIRAPSGRPRVYLRDDLWSFVVRGPLGTVECHPGRQQIVPIVDFFTRLSGRDRRQTFAAAFYCPEGTFAVPGVYEVTTHLDLIYGADEYDFEAVTGTFTGPPEPVRVTHGTYVEQGLDTLVAQP